MSYQTPRTWRHRTVSGRGSNKYGNIAAYQTFYPVLVVAKVGIIQVTLDATDPKHKRRDEETDKQRPDCAMNVM